jgi:hypothetical protein
LLILHEIMSHCEFCELIKSSLDLQLGINEGNYYPLYQSFFLIVDTIDQVSQFDILVAYAINVMGH